MAKATRPWDPVRVVLFILMTAIIAWVVYSLLVLSGEEDLVLTFFILFGGTLGLILMIAIIRWVRYFLREASQNKRKYIYVITSDNVAETRAAERLVHTLEEVYGREYPAPIFVAGSVGRSAPPAEVSDLQARIAEPRVIGVVCMGVSWGYGDRAKVGQMAQIRHLLRVVRREAGEDGAKIEGATAIRAVHEFPEGDHYAIVDNTFYKAESARKDLAAAAAATTSSFLGDMESDTMVNLNRAKTWALFRVVVDDGIVQIPDAVERRAHHDWYMENMSKMVQTYIQDRVNSRFGFKTKGVVELPAENQVGPPPPERLPAYSGRVAAPAASLVTPVAAGEEGGGEGEEEKKKRRRRSSSSRKRADSGTPASPHTPVVIAVEKEGTSARRRRSSSLMKRTITPAPPPLSDDSGEGE